MKIRFETEQLKEEEKKNLDHGEAIDFFWAKQAMLSFYFELVNLLVLRRANGYSEETGTVDYRANVLDGFKNTISSMINTDNVNVNEFDQTDRLNGLHDMWGRERSVSIPNIYLGLIYFKSP